MLVHAADLHLGAPLKSLGRALEPAHAERLRRLAADSFSRLVGLTIDQGARALLLAGDVYDDADREVSAQLRFRRAMNDLRDAGVTVFIAHGNHDPVITSYVPATKLPDNVIVFGAGEIESHPLTLSDGSALTVSGVSFTSRSETENLAQRFGRLADSGVDPTRSIAVLHTNVGNSSAHGNYAPCSIADLDAAPVTYWALGHIHQRSVNPLGPFRWWAYPGNLQGRSTKPAECDAKGALVVPLVADGVGEPRFHACDAVRFARLDVDVTSAGDLGDVLDLIATGVAGEVDRAEDRPVVLRVRLTGRTRAQSQLIASDNLLGDAQAHTSGLIGDGAIIKVEVSTRVAVDRSRLLERGDLLSKVLDRLDELRGDPARCAEWTSTLDKKMLASLPAGVIDLEVLDEIERILVNEMVGE